MPATVEVEGMDASPEELEDAGWTAAFRSRKGDVRNGPSGGGGQRGGVKATAGSGKVQEAVRRGLRWSAGASRMSRLPRNDIKVIVRPRGGLNVAKADIVHLAQALSMAAGLTEDQTKEDTVCPNKVQNIVVVSTPHEFNAMKYARVCKIYTRMGSFEVSAYVAAPENTCKGVLRNIDPSIDDEALKRMVVTGRNPTILEVKRIKTTSAVVVLFDGMKVPDTVVCGTALVPCYLYRRQVDVCYACGQVGHRADVCPSSAEEKAKCRGCRVPVVSGPTGEVQRHECVPTCGLCGGPHLTGCKECKERFQVPYVVRRRRRRRRQRARNQQIAARDGAGRAEGGESSAVTAAAGKPSILRSRSRGRSRSQSRGRSRSATRTDATGQRSSQREASARSHSRGRSQPDKHTTWVDKAKNQPKPGPPERRGRSPSRSEHVVNPRMLALEAENKQLRRDLAELKAAFESFKERAQGDRKEHGPLWGKAKRRALDPAEGQSESTAAVVAGQLEAAPSSVAGGVEDRWARMETTLSRMMDVLSSLEGRIAVLERPKALAKGRHETVAESQLHDPGPSREGSAAADVIECAS